MSHPTDSGALYAQLALRIEQHLPGYIDAYFGPPEWKTQALAAGPLPLPDLMAQVDELAQTVAASTLEPRRKRYLAKQVNAMRLTVRLLAGEHIPFLEEVEGLYDITPQRVDDAVFVDALRELDQLLPGEGPVNARLRARRARFAIAPERANELFLVVKAELRRRTHALFDLPRDEDVELSLVADKPWSAYNWFLGRHRSLVEINTDSPLYANALVGLMAHEGYPGHHTEHAIKESLHYEEHGWSESCVLLINAPECVISEGIATTAADIIFAAGEAEQWQREMLYSQAGIHDDLSAEHNARLQHAMRALGGLSGNAAFMLHVDGKSTEEVVEYIVRYSSRTPDEAKRSIRFLTDPLFRSYTFTYTRGHELLSELFARHDRLTVFKRVLTEPLTPTDLVEWLSASAVT